MSSVEFSNLSGRSRGGLHAYHTQNEAVWRACSSWQPIPFERENFSWHILHFLCPMSNSRTTWCIVIEEILENFGIFEHWPAHDPALAHPHEELWAGATHLPRPRAPTHWPPTSCSPPLLNHLWPGLQTVQEDSIHRISTPGSTNASSFIPPNNLDHDHIWNKRSCQNQLEIC